MNEDDPKPTGVIRDAKGRFVVGGVGNPSGRPPGSISLADKLRKRLAEHPEEADSIISALIKLGIGRDMRAIEHSFAYVDGKPVERHRFEGELPIKLVFVPAKELLDGLEKPQDAQEGASEG